jgi:O-methyltransferase
VLTKLSETRVAPLQSRLRTAIGRPVKGVFGRLGYSLVQRAEPAAEFPIPPDCDSVTAGIIRRVQPYTLTPPPRIMALCESVRHLTRAGIRGPIVECGVWRGGSMLAAVLTLLELGDTDRELHMFDTFTEMPEPDERDVHMSGASGPEFFEKVVSGDATYDLHRVEEVRELLAATGYPPDRLQFVQGLVEETIPARAPETIALLRLDTDWYRSTVHEMEHLYPRVVSGGILIVDDYGEFSGARDAVDEQLGKDGRPVLLNRVDFSCRLIQVP